LQIQSLINIMTYKIKYCFYVAYKKLVIAKYKIYKNNCCPPFTANAPNTSEAEGTESAGEGSWVHALKLGLRAIERSHVLQR
jgi:hypothetical protein